jgi:SpoVK/Ycf46/Vps4 family AAA+-type ATPase
MNKKDFLFSKNIKEKQMYYNSGEGEQIKKLENLLLHDNLENVRKRLVQSGLRTGFTCLFSGPPGTGKTETVYQIARKTGRDLMVVDISQIRSMWVGESEKNIKAIFTRYRDHVKISENIPILFFNEADSIINSRMEFSDESRPRAVEKMENTIQNIILQELETLDGIIIAATNMTQNMDKAFERRFLYKIEFKKPEKQVRKMLWKSMLPQLNEEEADVLASRFDFTGGQIENIARKKTIDYVLYNLEHDLSKLVSYCEEETLNQAAKQQKELMDFLLWLSYLVFLRWVKRK